MCGNGGRCAARFAVMHGIAPETSSFETLAGTIKAEVKGRRVKLLMAGVGDFILEQTIPLEEANLSGHFLQVGVPHVVVPVDDLEAAPVTGWGRLIRFHPLFAPRGPTSISSGLKAPKPSGSAPMSGGWKTKPWPAAPAPWPRP